ncbi:MAG: toprim domain-containing protein, partial [Candidatus Atribacteria bacterium]|nr:toprim domain-containing protein [Candidatus Atribacteria bacterium]
QARRIVSVEATKKEGKNWIALCPFHPDKNRPNLYIDEEKEKYHCFTCGKNGFLYNPKYLKLKYSYHRNIAATYNYKDELGNLLYQVVRFNPKGFSQRRPAGNNDWIWNMKGVNPVPYHLPEIIQSIEPVMIVEGEKDVENLRRMGFTATTSPMGAGKWKASYNKYLKNKEVILIPDHDQPGYQHCQRIGQSLRGIAGNIKWLDLPDLEEKEDISDWIEKGNTKEKLLQLIKEAPDFIFEKYDERESNEKPINIILKDRTKSIVPDLIHLVGDQGRTKYLFCKNGQWLIEEYFIQDNKRYSPKQNLPIKILKPNIINRSLNLDIARLATEIDTFIKSYLEMPLDSDYLILSMWIFHTYLIENFNTTPILYFYGVKETGKSRVGEVLNELAFRAQRLTSLTEATLFRSVELFKPTLIIDEIKLMGKGGNQGLADLIKTTYKRGLKVSRINLNKYGEDQIEYYDTFTPLVICTTESIPDIIESRCILFIMQKNSNPQIERMIDKKWANDLRERLTVFRANYINKDLPEAQHIARGRLNEIMFPLYQSLLLFGPERKDEFIDTVKRIQKNKENEDGMSLEAEIVKAINDEYQENQESQFLTQAISKRINELRSENESISDRAVSNRIKRLGFNKLRFNNGRMGFRINEERLSCLKNKYRITHDAEGSEGSEG